MDDLAKLKQVMGSKRAMELFYTFGKQYGTEDTTVPGLGGKGTFAMTAEQAQAEMADLKRNKDFAKLFTSQDPKTRMEARERMDRLARLAYPGQTDYSGTGTART